MTNTQSSDYVCKGLTEGRMFFPTPTHCFQCGGARWETPDRPVTSNEPSPLESAPPGGRRSEVSMNSVDPPAQEINAHSVQVTFAGAVCVRVCLSFSPIAVQASPITTPGGVTSYIRSTVKIGLPTNSCRFSGVTITPVCSPFTIQNATLRKTCGQ